ncbi:MAG: RodZ domain-containing protein [Pseudomonadota bacterium]
MSSMHDVGPGQEAAPPATDRAQDAGAAPLGGLREAREATGLSREEFARRAHLPAAVLADLEEGRWEHLGAAVFVRGYLRSFARAARLPDAMLADLLSRHGDAPPPLVAQRSAPIAQRWLSRYAAPAGYALLTAVVMVPLVYLARPVSHPAVQAPSLTPIDNAGERSVSTASPAASSGAIVAPTPIAPSPATTPGSLVSAGPVMASLAPVPQVAAAPGSRRVNLRLAADSWVEFSDAAGRRLEYGLLPAGTARDYDLQGSAVLMIGNASAARLTVDGREVDLGPLSSGNDVARVRFDDPAAPESD